MKNILDILEDPIRNIAEVSKVCVNIPGRVWFYSGNTLSAKVLLWDLQLWVAKKFFGRENALINLFGRENAEKTASIIQWASY